MRNSKRFLALLMAVVLVLLLALPAGADFGDFSSDTDFGGGSDWGGSDWGGSYDSDYGDYDSDFDGVFGFLDGISFRFAVIIVVGFLIVNWIRESRGGKKNSGTARSSPVRTTGSQDGLQPMSNYTRLDPNFNQTELSGRLANLYVQLQNGWTAKNIDSLRPYFTDAAFEQYSRQLEQFRQRRITNYVERISVMQVGLLGFRQVGGQDQIVAQLKTRITDYTLSDDTGELIKGSRTAEKFMTYQWTLVRASGQRSGITQGTETASCPNCGAPIALNASAQCSYCGSVLTREAVDFAIAEIRVISQNTSGR